MRYDEEIKIRYNIDREYDEETGDMVKVGIEEGDVVWANVHETPHSVQSIIKGRVSTGTVTVRINGYVEEEVEVLEYKNKRYKVDSLQYIKNSTIIVMSEV